MGKANDYYDSNHKPHAENNGYIDERVRTTWNGQLEYVTHHGYVVTRYGFVIVWSDNSPQCCTSMDFIWRKRVHHRVWNHYFRPRHLVTLAKRFAAEIAQEGQS